MEKNSTNQGYFGEQIAKNFLIKQQYQILETNWRFKKYEIDIIAKKDECIIFVEVKTRKNNTFGEPELSVTKQKQRNIIAAANQYMIENNLDLEARFDIVAVIQLNHTTSIKHLEAAYYPLIK